MKDVWENDGPVRAMISDEPEGWAPPEAPLDMPPQVLETPAVGLDLGQIFRMILPRQRI